MSTTSRASLVLLTVSLLACASDPDPQERVAPAPARPAREDPAPAPPAAPPSQQPRLLIVTAKPFPEEVMSILPGDLVEVTLQTGGRTSGWVTAIRPRELAITAEGTRIITRLTPEAVTSVKVTYRPPRLISSSDGPGRGREGWLPHNFVRLVLEGLPHETWGGLLGRNLPLTVRRQFSLASWDHLEQAADRHLFNAVETPTQLLPGDQLKLCAVVRGAERLKVGERQLGDVFVLLHKREERITHLFTTDAIHPSDLERQGLVTWLKQELVTLIVYRPAPPVTYAKIARVPRSAARAYMQRVELLPDRAVVRKMRAEGDPALPKVEAQVKALHDSLGLPPEDSLRDGPLVMEMRIPTLQGGLFVLPFRKEFGLD